MSKLVSIIIPYFNNISTLEEALYSCINSKYKNIEIIVVDDGSEVGVPSSILKNIDFKSVKFLHKKNGGAASARNYGVSNALGEYILFLDADDLILDTYISKAVGVLDSNNNTKLVYCQAVMFNKEKEFYWNLNPMSIYELYTSNCIFICSMIRRNDFDILGGFDTKLLALEDWDLWIRLVDYEYEVHQIQEVLFKYRIDQEDYKSLTNIYLKDEEKRLKLQQMIYEKNAAKIIRTLGHPGVLYTKIKAHNKKFWRRFKKIRI